MKRASEADFLIVVGFRGIVVEDEGRNFGLVAQWAENAGNRRELLVDNATRLFGFGPLGPNP